MRWRIRLGGLLYALDALRELLQIGILRHHVCEGAQVRTWQVQRSSARLKLRRQIVAAGPRMRAAAG